MTMHLAPVYVSTVNHGKSKRKTNKKQQRSISEHEAWLRKRGLADDQIQARKTKTKIDLSEPNMYIRKPDLPPVSNYVGNGYKREEKTYTGTLIKGVATMHKSNAVPVINKQQAEEISRMRRG